MTSVVDTSVKYFSSLMPGAPVLSGTVGSLIAVLDACLKDGFDVKVLASLVVSGGVATCTWVGTHSALPDAVIAVSGVTGGPTGWADLNGEQKVMTKPGGTSCTFATAVADGTATGTISIKIAPIGWLKPYSGTNLAAYQSNDPTSSKCLLRVDDTAAQVARVVGYETMSDINTGLGPFPTNAQLAGGGYWPKSMTTSATAIAWSIFGDGKLFFFNSQPGNTSGALYQTGNNRMFGDPIPLKPGGDPFCAVLNYSINATGTSQQEGGVSLSATGNFNYASPREYTGLGSAVVNNSYAFVSAGQGASYYSGISTLIGSFPAVIDGGMWLSPKYIGIQPRSLIPGVLFCAQGGLWDTFRHGDRVPGAGAYAGKYLIAATGAGGTGFTTLSTNANTGVIFFDSTGPWR